MTASQDKHARLREEWSKEAMGDAEMIPTLDEYRSLARSRRVVRSFRDEPLPDGIIEDVLEAANWAPSGANAQPWHFIVVEDDETKEQMADIFRDEIKYKGEVDPYWPGAGNSRAFIEAPAVIVIAGDTRKERWWPQVLDGSREKLFHHSMAACVMSLHLAAASAGLAATWVTTRRPSAESLRELLDIPQWMRIASTAPLGYPDTESSPMEKHREPLEDKVHHEEFDREKLPDLETIMDGVESWRERVYQPELHERPEE